MVLSKKADILARRRFLQMAMATSLYGASGLPGLGSRAARAADFPTSVGNTLVNLFFRGGADLRHLFMPPFDDSDGYGREFWQARRRSQNTADNDSAMRARFSSGYFLETDATTGTEFGILRKCEWLHDMWVAGNVAIIANVVGSDSRDHSFSIEVMDSGDTAAGKFDRRNGWGGRLAVAAGANSVALTRTPRTFVLGPDPAAPTDLGRINNDSLIIAGDTREIGLERVADTAGNLGRRDDVTRAVNHYYREIQGDVGPASPLFVLFEHERKLREFGQQVEDRLAEFPVPADIEALYANGGTINRYLGRQMRNVYDAFAARDILNMRVASIEYGGWDTHNDQLNEIEENLEDVFGRNKALSALWSELPDAIRQEAVILIQTEFGRQWFDNGGNGTDHGEGNYMILIGESVRGGVYGDMYPREELDRRSRRSPDIEGLTDIDHVFGAVCEWVSPGSKSVVFANAADAKMETPNFDQALIAMLNP